MAWHLNVRHGYYSRRLRRELTSYSNEFGVRDGTQTIILGEINFDLVELETNGMIRFEGDDYYRIIIWYAEPSFYVSTSKENGPRYYLSFSYPGN
jgi:hypothetical protein